MYVSYGVVWREGDHEVVAGKLELLPQSLRLDGRNGGEEIPYDRLAGVHVGRSAGERLGGRPAVVLQRHGAEDVTIAPVAQSHLVGEIAERLVALSRKAQAA
jgi:hypothetical protein